MPSVSETPDTLVVAGWAAECGVGFWQMVFAKPKPRYQRWQRIFLSLEINCVKLMVVGRLSKELTGQHDRSVFPLGKN